MKGTLIPLDVLWLDSAGVIVDIQTMHPQPGVPDGQLTIYRPRSPARYAIEMNAGLAERHRFQPGVKVVLELEGPK
jgi:uncharacterized membrane protein (UPF0127 family)